MQDEPEVRVLHGTRAKWVWVFLVMAAFFAVGLAPGYREENPFMAWLTVAFCGLGSVFSLAMLVAPGARGTLTLDAQGFEIRTFGRRHRTSWADVAGFGLIRISGARMISIEYQPGYARQRAAREIAAGLTGAEGAIPDNYEVSGAALAELLERWRAHFSR